MASHFCSKPFSPGPVMLNFDHFFLFLSLHADRPPPREDWLVWWALGLPSYWHDSSLAPPTASRHRRPGLRQWLWLFVIGVGGDAVANTFITLGYSLGHLALVALLQQSQPVFGLLGACLVLREDFHAKCGGHPLADL